MHPVNKFPHYENKRSLSNNQFELPNQIDYNYEIEVSRSTLHPFQIVPTSNSSKLSLPANHPLCAFEKSPLDVLSNDITTIVLEYCANSVSASAANVYARQDWYRQLKKELKHNIKMITREINCDSAAEDPQTYCLEVSSKIHKFLHNAGLIPSLDKIEFNDLNLIPHIEKIQIIIDEDLCTTFEKISKEITNEQLNHILSSENTIKDKAEFIRKWLTDSNQRKCLENITNLRLNLLGLRTLPFEIYHFSKIEKLYLANNQLQQIPESINKLSHLVDFDMMENNLQGLPQPFFQLTQLQVLNLANNIQLSAHENIGQLTQLQSLYLYSSNLDRIPDSFRNLKNLKFLALNHNNLLEIPDFIGEFTQLVFLGLSKNKLQYIPDNISKLPNLDFLEIKYNPLKRLHRDFLKFNEYRRIDLSELTLYKLCYSKNANCTCIIA